jgi:2-polyprenyl-6-methoxyphenol hydroxylase-like FAD-dependent oxidoreductase
MATRHAEVIGGGFAGLSAATALRQHGWSVTLHERGPTIRAFGSALALSENGLKVLEMLGAYDEAVRGAFPLDNRETRDGAGNLISSYNWKTESATLRMFMLLRSRVIRALEKTALEAGVEIRTSSDVVDFDPGGEISVGGATRRADLVVAAGGAGSRSTIRQRLLKSQLWFKDGSIRLLLPSRARYPWPDGTFVEYWSGRRRAMLVPCSEDHFYLGLIARKGDLSGTRVPIDTKSWAGSFPHLKPFLENVGDQERWSWDQYQSVVLKRWHEGKVALIGDAAHAMSPNFGQGAALAMVSALSLASILSDHVNVVEGLLRWERTERPLIDRTQFLSGLYSGLMGWPDALRSPALAMMGRSRWIMRQRTLAAYRTPPGYRQISSIATSSAGTG